MGFFKRNGRDQAAPEQAESSFSDAAAETASPADSALRPEEAAADEAGAAAAGAPGTSSGFDEPPESAPTTDDDAAAGRLIENQLLAMVDQLVHSRNDSDDPHSSQGSPADLPQRADDYPQDQTEGGRPDPGSGDDSIYSHSNDGERARPVALSPRPDDEELERLRQLLLGREIDGLESVARYLNDPERLSQALSQVITEAIRLRVRRDNELIGVLKPTVDNIVRNSMRNNPAELADNLFPVMGPAIRRSISESIRGMLQEFSRTLEKSFSLTGLKWRLESMRTGMKFSEVVMLKTLEYQVEQIFVIHAESGLKLLHLVNENAKEEVRDSDQVAAMFTAIQQFVNDSFARGELSTLEFGDRNIYVARAPQVYAACVVLGQAPPNLRIDLQTALELLVMECADELDNFQANQDSEADFSKSFHHFDSLLVSRYKDENQKLPLRAKLLPIMLAAVVLGALGFWGYENYQMTKMEKLVLQAVDRPGLVALQVKPSIFGPWTLTCLKDELASSPAMDLELAGLPPERYSIEYLPYVSQDDEIVAQRIRLAMADKPQSVDDHYDPATKTLTLSGQVPIGWFMQMYERLRSIPGLAQVKAEGLTDPQTGVVAVVDEQGVMHLKGQASINWAVLMHEKLMALSGVPKVDISGVSDPRNGVSASLENDILYLKGQASIGWLESVRELAARTSGINGVNQDNIVYDPESAEIKGLVEDINGTVIFFQLNKDQPVPGDDQKLQTAVDKLLRLEQLAKGMDLTVSLVIYGHADPTGAAKHNYDLSQQRTKALAAMLYARHSGIPISTYGLGADFAVPAEGGSREQRVEAEQASRKIELRVNLNRKVTSLAP